MSICGESTWWQMLDISLSLNHFSVIADTNAMWLKNRGLWSLPHWRAFRSRLDTVLAPCSGCHCWNRSWGRWTQRSLPTATILLLTSEILMLTQKWVMLTLYITRSHSATYVSETPTANSGNSAHRTRGMGWPLILKPLILKNIKRQHSKFWVSYCKFHSD